MQVAVDANPLYSSRAGVARYVRSLLCALDKVRVRGGMSSLTPLAWEVENFEYKQPARMIKTFWREFVWATVLGPVRLSAMKPDLFHSTAGVLLQPSKCIPHVVTVHDTAVFDHPERFRGWHRKAGITRLRRSLYADRIICISRFTADRLISVTGCPVSKIEIVYNGGGMVPSGLVRAPSSYELVPAGEFFLFVGSLEPGKNLQLLLETYTLAASKGISLPRLLVAGARWEGTKREHGNCEDITFLGRVSDAELAELYSRALALVFPSKYEGFGLPLLEAMGAGCPVICSPVGSLPEVGGEAALWADQTPDAYLQRLQDVANERIDRAGVIKAGYQQAARFSWDRCASETVAVYESVVR